MKNQIFIRFAVTLLVIFGINSGAFAQQIDETDPYAMVQGVATLTFDRIKNEKQNIKKSSPVIF